MSSLLERQANRLSRESPRRISVGRGVGASLRPDGSARNLPSTIPPSDWRLALLPMPVPTRLASLCLRIAGDAGMVACWRCVNRVSLATASLPETCSCTLGACPERSRRRCRDAKRHIGHRPISYAPAQQVMPDRALVVCQRCIAGGTGIWPSGPLVSMKLLAPIAAAGSYPTNEHIL